MSFTSVLVTWSCSGGELSRVSPMKQDRADHGEWHQVCKKHQEDEAHLDDICHHLLTYVDLLCDSLRSEHLANQDGVLLLHGSPHLRTDGAVDRVLHQAEEAAPSSLCGRQERVPALHWQGEL